jgi:hypothetical protein
VDADSILRKYNLKILSVVTRQCGRVNKQESMAQMAEKLAATFETPCPTRSLQSKLTSSQHFPRGMPVAVDHHMLRASQNCGFISYPISETESRGQQQALPVPQAHG